MKTLKEFKEMAKDGRSIKAKLHLAIMNTLVNETDHTYCIFRCSNGVEADLTRLLLNKGKFAFSEGFDPFREGTTMYHIYLCSDTFQDIC